MGKGCSPCRLLFVFLYLSQAGRHQVSRTCSTASKRLRKLADFVFPDGQKNVAEQPTLLAGCSAESRPGPSPGRASL
jgi:hypothetical protein